MSEQSELIASTWINGTAPAIAQLRQQGVNVDIEKVGQYAANVNITKFPGYDGEIRIWVDGWLLIPEFQVLLFLTEKTALSGKINFNDDITISIGKINYSFYISEGKKDIIDYLAIQRADSFYSKSPVDSILLELIIFDTYEPCTLFYPFDDIFCFSALEVTNFDTNKTIILVKDYLDFYNDGTEIYTTLGISATQRIKESNEFGNVRKYIVFANSMNEFVNTHPTNHLSVAIVQRMSDSFGVQSVPFETVAMRKKILIGKKFEGKYWCGY